MSDLRVLQVSGSPYEIGYTHGKAFTREITELTEERLRLSSDPLWTGGQQPTLDEVLALGAACLADHAEFAPELMAEMQGMADATGLGVNELVIMNGFTDFVDVVANPECAGRPPRPERHARHRCRRRRLHILHRRCRGQRPTTAATWARPGTCTPPPRPTY